MGFRARYEPCTLLGTMTRRPSRILIVDDPEGRLSRSLVPALAPHKVDVARDALDTIDRIDSAGRPYDLIFCDLERGDVPGPELWAYLSLRRREAADRIIFVASGPQATKAKAFLARIPNPRIELPVDPNELDALARQHAAVRVSAWPMSLVKPRPRPEREPA